MILLANIDYHVIFENNKIEFDPNNKILLSKFAY